MNSKLDAIVELAKRYDYDAAHAHQVECLAGTLFMELEPLHKLAREDRKLLEYAAILHDIGYFLTSKGHHKHTLQLIMMEPFPDFTRSEKLIIANTARYHRKTGPTTDHTHYAILTEREKHRVDLLVPLLRLADALDKSHKSVIRELACHIREDTVLFLIGTNGEADVELDALMTRSELFRSVYGRDLTIELATHAALAISASRSEEAKVDSEAMA